MNIHDLADALGDLRCQIRHLRAYEADLRQAILNARPNGPVSGEGYEVQVRRSSTRRIDRNKLPTSILANDNYWTVTDTESVVTKPITG